MQGEATQGSDVHPQPARRTFLARDLPLTDLPRFAIVNPRTVVHAGRAAGRVSAMPGIGADKGGSVGWCLRTGGDAPGAGCNSPPPAATKRSHTNFTACTHNTHK